ncbi:MAG: hypothetical protein K1X78_06935 [Verrucomicrobiaceae bacterium]|nr:hypothetical protein [Verrucomicrobiaceae bacterium]
MTSTRLPGAFTIAAGGLFCLFAIVSIMLGEGNTLANVFLYLIIGTCGLAIIEPRTSFFIFLVTCGYVDLFKRLMVVSGRVSMDDLFYVLGLAPALFSCIIVSVVVRGVIGGLPMGRQHMRLFVIGCAVVFLNAFLSYLDVDHSIGKVMQGTANGGLYGMLIFVVPMLFHEEDDVLHLFKFLLWTYFPVGFYGIVQKVWGFQDFELAYLMTGLSIEIKQLFTDRVRAFSTLNSPTALGAISAAFVALPVYLASVKTANRHRRVLPMALAVVFSLVHLGSLAASTSRTGFIMVAVMVAGIIAFRTRTGTIAFYSVGGAAFATLLVGARYMLDRIEGVTDRLLMKFGGSVSDDTININTFSDRLHGFADVLTNPEAYTWFGYGAGRGVDPRDPLYNHDLLSNTLVRYGAVPLTVLVVSAIVFLTWTHAHLLGIRDKRRRNICAAMLALAMSLFAISITSGNVLSIFPVNTFFWLAVTATIVVVSADARAQVSVRQTAPLRAGEPHPGSESSYVTTVHPMHLS